MRTCIALLRGINITGHRKLPMADLRDLCGGLGLADPETYIQSGNVLFESDLDTSSIEEAIRGAVADRFGYDISVLVRRPSLFEKIVNENPFAGRDPSFQHVTLLASAPDGDLAAAVEQGAYGEDELVVRSDVAYVYCPNGYGRTKLNNNFLEARLRTVATTRNWRTVNKLLEMARIRMEGSSQ